MSYREYLNEVFNLNFDSAKSNRSKDEWDDFLAYEEKLFKLKKLAFEAGYELAIRWTGNDNSKNGFFDIMNSDSEQSMDMEPTKPIKSFEDFNMARTWLLSNYKNKK